MVNYTNPTGLCTECQTTLDQGTSADQLPPVCCDELPFKSGNCDNTGEGRCDTRFRWTIRSFGASLETRLPNVPLPGTPNYFFTDCTMSPSKCPFSEMSTAFGQGPTALLGVTPNPLPVSKTDFTEWTVSSYSLAHTILIIYNCYIGTNSVFHRSIGQRTPEHNRQFVD